MQFSAAIFFQLTQKIYECLLSYVTAFFDAFIAPAEMAMTIEKRYIVQP